MQTKAVTANEAGQRLDKLLAKTLPKAPKSFIYKMLRKKNITLNDKKAEGAERLEIGDQIKLWLADETIEKFTAEAFVTVKDQLNILYEDTDILVLNKPAGVLCQKAIAKDVSINEEIISYLLRRQEISPEMLLSFRPAVCHRLDRNTSGVLIAGKSLHGLQVISKLIHDHRIQKYYLCLVHGKITETTYIEGYLLKDEKLNKVRIVAENVPGSDRIETEYEPLKSNGKYTLIKVHLITGKSHQIRAHLASVGHALTGDYKYGEPKANDEFAAKYRLKHQFLHCYQMIMPVADELPEISKRIFEAPLPKKLLTILVKEQCLPQYLKDTEEN